jgi:hypothetical protein
VERVGERTAAQIPTHVASIADQPLSRAGGGIHGTMHGPNHVATNRFERLGEVDVREAPRHLRGMPPKDLRFHTNSADQGARGYLFLTYRATVRRIGSAQKGN